MLAVQGDVYEKDCTVDGGFFLRLCEEICEAVQQLYADWDVEKHGPRPETVTVQIDGAGPHRSKAVEDALDVLGRACEPRVIWWRQEAQCPQAHSSPRVFNTHFVANVSLCVCREGGHSST